MTKANWAEKAVKVFSSPSVTGERNNSPEVSGIHNSGIYVSGHIAIFSNTENPILITGSESKTGQRAVQSPVQTTVINQKVTKESKKHKTSVK